MDYKIRCWLVVFCCFQQVFSAILVEGHSNDGKHIWREGTEYRHKSIVPVPSEKDLRKFNSYNYNYNVPEKQKTKKWKISRLFFTLPIGATFPVFFSSQKGYKKSQVKGKKSDIYFSPDEDFVPNVDLEDRDAFLTRSMAFIRERRKKRNLRYNVQG